MDTTETVVDLEQVCSTIASFWKRKDIDKIEETLEQLDRRNIVSSSSVDVWNFVEAIEQLLLENNGKSFITECMDTEVLKHFGSMLTHLAVDFTSI